MRIYLQAHCEFVKPNPSLTLPLISTCVWNKQVAFQGFQCGSAHRSLLARTSRHY